ncbi:MAG: hypothetical protein EOO61_05465 [Hymenobacter sp.]|nr:MAG: hypothetical protein EOO61_05465 [Hymenobacter sp.]
MKILSLFLGFSLFALASSSAQKRLSIAPLYWYEYTPYSYQVSLNYNGLPTQSQGTGHTSVSSIGLTASYHFAPQWNLSLGVLYSRNTIHIQSPQGPFGELPSFTSKGVRIPLLISYRLTDNRLSPYVSGGAVFTKNNTYTEDAIKTDGLIGVGLDYRFNSALSLLLQPTASYSFSPPINSSVYHLTNYRSYALGIQTQLIWHF